MFRLRIGREDPALLPELKVPVMKGATLRPGYKIKHTYDQRELDALAKQLEELVSMGVIAKAEPGSILHSLLSVAKPDGTLRWVITCITANDITLEMRWYSPDNTEAQQSRMKGAKFFWACDLTKGFWQIKLDEDSQWLFCFATPWGNKKWLRAPMGSKVTAVYFDMCLAKARRKKF